MSAGTLTLTNNSAAVAGSGTAFNTEVAAGDFIVVTVGGVPYTLPIKSVESGTALTLVSNFTGPTQAGAAWSAVPRMALNMVTAALVAQSTEALRGLNYDKQNWQQVFSGTGNVTVRLPDGATFTGPSWKYLTDNAVMKNNGVVPVSEGGTGASTEVGARSILYAASGQYGFGAIEGWQTFNRTLSGSTLPSRPGVYYANSSTWASSDFGAVLVFSNGGDDRLPSATGSWINILELGNDGNIYYKMDINGTVSSWFKQYSDKNTTIDGNGNLKPASPIVKIFGNGAVELNDESEGVTVTHVSTGVYLLSGVTGLNADPLWGGVDGGVVIPKDINNQPLIWADYSVEPDGDILLRTYHRTHHNAPEFARNLIGIKNKDGSFTETVKDGEPVDIPVGRWVDVRVQMPEGSVWNQKQLAIRETMEKAERERQENQQED